MTERSGVEIDYCPQCRGVWLDRGELDKILDRAATASPAPAPARPAPPPLYTGQDRRNDNPGYDRGHDRRHKKKEGWLGELFDF